MQELIDKYNKWHDDTPIKWKVACIEKARLKQMGYSITNINWAYDDAIDLLTDKSKTIIKNLAKKLNYNEIPCYHCKQIFKHWNHNTDWKWSPDKKHLFPNE